MLKDIYNQIAKDLNLDPEVVMEAYKSQWKFIKEHIESLPLKGEFNSEEFKKLRTNFNLPSLGKLYTTEEKIQKMKRRVEFLKKIIPNVKTEKDNTCLYIHSSIL